MADLLRLLLAGAFGFVIGSIIVGGLVWAHMAIICCYWLETWKTEARLRARDRYERAGEMDRHPFRAPPLEARIPRIPTKLIRRFFRMPSEF